MSWYLLMKRGWLVKNKSSMLGPRVGMSTIWGGLREIVCFFFALLKLSLYIFTVIFQILEAVEKDVYYCGLKKDKRKNNCNSIVLALIYS